MTETPLFHILLTLIAYLIGESIYKKTKWIILNPLLVAMILIMVFLYESQTSYETYRLNNQWIDWLLQPAIVSLGVPLYQQLPRIKLQLVNLMITTMVASITGILTVIIVSWSMGAPYNIICSIIPKSVTTPIAMDISKAIEGIPSITACVVICTGLIGAVSGFILMKFLKINNPMAQGLSMGVASHVLGASKSMELSANYGAFATVGLILNGIFTAIFAPFLLRFLPLISPI